VAIVMLGCFAVIESRSRSPLLPPRVVAEYHRALLYVAGFLADAAQLSMFLFLTYYFQALNGYNALRTGFAFLPFALAVILTAGVSGRPFVRVGPFALMLTGAALSTLALLALGTLGAHEPYATRIMLPEIIMGMGVALSLVPMNNVVLAGIDPEDAGVASAALNATGQMGNSMGSALLNSVFVTSVAGYLAVRVHHGDLADASVYGNDIVFRCESAMYACALVLIALAALHLRRNAGQRS
jgi:predicted MFS family arabinose efflux permease